MSTSTQVTIPAEKVPLKKDIIVDLQEKLKQITIDAKALVAKPISDAASVEAASAILVRLGKAKKYVKENLDPVVEHEKRIHQEAIALRGSFLDPLTEFDVAIRQKILAWQKEEDRKAEEAAAAERKRLQEEAENKRKEDARLAAEAAAIAQAQAEAIEEDDPIEADRLRYEAEQAQADAQKNLSAPLTITAPPPIVGTVAKAVAGVGTTETWKGDVVDLFALVVAVAEKRAPIEILAPVQKVVNDVAKGVRSEGIVNGIRVWKEKGLRVGGK